MRWIWLALGLWACDDGGGAVPAEAGEPSVDARAGAGAALDAGLHAGPDAAPPDWGPFERFEGVTARAPTERLCPASDDPEAAPDKVFIECAVDGARYAPAAPPTDTLRVMAYNIERGFQIDAQLARLAEDPPDVILLTEADRGCARTGGRHITDEYAQALGMDFVFATEFVELKASGACEHGNAVLSRYPIGNVRAIRHATNQSWFDDPGEPRLGGRVAVRADLDLGAGRRLRVYALHLESALDQSVRAAQAAEIAADAPAWATVAGGDLNSGLYAADLRRGLPVDEMVDETVQAFLQAGFEDAHAALPIDDRATHPDPLPFVLDVIVGRGPLRFTDPAVGDASWSSLSDHLPIGVTVRLE